VTVNTLILGTQLHHGRPQVSRILLTN